jgi:hypothetical protein
LDARGGLLPREYLWATTAISTLVLVTSLSGIFVAGTYARDTASWAQQARAQDFADLAAVFILAVSTYLASRRSVRGFQVWAGVMLFVIYTFAIFAFASAFNGLFLVYVAVFGLATYSFIGGVLRLDFEAIGKLAPIGQRAGTPLGLLLIALALAFAIIWLGQDVPAILNDTVPLSVTQAGLLTNPIHVLDLALYLPAIFVSGLSLLRGRALGQVFSLPFLVFSALEGLGIFLIFAI